MPAPRQRAAHRGDAGEVVVKAYIGLGSNLGERESMIRQALEALSELPDTDLVRA